MILLWRLSVLLRRLITDTYILPLNSLGMGIKRLFSLEYKYVPARCPHRDPVEIGVKDVLHRYRSLSGLVVTPLLFIITPDASLTRVVMNCSCIGALITSSQTVMGGLLYMPAQIIQMMAFTQIMALWTPAITL